MKPILFNSEMVRAILDGRKTVTRRLIKCKYSNTHLQMFTNKYGTRLIELQNDVEGETFGKNEDGTSWHKLLGMREVEYDHKPYKRGDILYVRETWRVGAWDENTSSIAIDYQTDGFTRKEWIHIEDEEAFQRYMIQSTDDAEKAGLTPDVEGQYHWKPGEGPTRWRPSIHMPKEAARIFLRVAAVRVEQLQDITASQAKKEGALSKCIGCKHFNDCCGELAYTALDCMYESKEEMKTEFTKPWESTVEKSDLDSYGWDANPFVWVIEFEQISKEEADELRKNM